MTNTKGELTMTITDQTLSAYRKTLIAAERATATIEKYMSNPNIILWFRIPEITIPIGLVTGVGETKTFWG